MKMSSTIKAGEFVLIAATKQVVQVRTILEDTDQALVYDVLLKKYLTVDLHKLQTTIPVEQEREFGEHLLVVNETGKSTEPGKRQKVDEARQIVSIRLADGTVIEAPGYRVKVDGTQMIPSDLIVFMISQNLIGLPELAAMTRLNTAYKTVMSSNRIWKTLLLKNYRNGYLKYLDATTGDIVPYLSNAVNQHTRSAHKHNKNVYKRLFEFWQKSGRGGTETISLEKYPHGIKGYKTSSKYFVMAFQCKDCIIVMMTSHLPVDDYNNSILYGQLVFRVAHDVDLQEMFRAQTASLVIPEADWIFKPNLATAKKIYIHAYNQNGFVAQTLGIVEETYNSLYYYSADTKTLHEIRRPFPLHIEHQRIIVRMAKDVFSIAYFEEVPYLDTSINAVSYVYSRIHPENDPMVVENVLILSTYQENSFYALDMSTACIHVHLAKEWSPNADYTEHDVVKHNDKYFKCVSSWPWTQQGEFLERDWLEIPNRWISLIPLPDIILTDSRKNLNTRYHHISRVYFSIVDATQFPFIPAARTILYDYYLHWETEMFILVEEEERRLVPNFNDISRYLRRSCVSHHVETPFWAGYDTIRSVEGILPATGIVPLRIHKNCHGIFHQDGSLVSYGPSTRKSFMTKYIDLKLHPLDIVSQQQQVCWQCKTQPIAGVCPIMGREFCGRACQEEAFRNQAV